MTPHSPIRGVQFTRRAKQRNHRSDAHHKRQTSDPQIANHRKTKNIFLASFSQFLQSLKAQSPSTATEDPATRPVTLSLAMPLAPTARSGFFHFQTSSSHGEC